jgi:DNA invertase Pin-like site-specific DNA recombinase
MRARLYIRRSDDDQSAYSPEAQERRARDYCAARGYVVVGVHLDDDLSGKLEHRGNLQRLLAAAMADPGSVVVVDKFDRLARDTELLLRTVYKTLLPRRVTVESVTESIDPYTPLGKAMLTVSGSFSTYYVDNLAQEVSKGLREKWERGGVVGNPPYGYRRVFELDGRGERIPATDTLAPTADAPIVLYAFERYATGAYSAAGLAELLNAEGHTHTGRGGARVPFTIDAVRGILACPTYAGLTAYRGETRPGRHAAIVPPELWARAQEVRARRADGHVGKSTAKTASLLSDLAYCGVCGEKLHFHPAGGGAYYRCKTRRLRGATACGASMVALSPVEAQLQAMLSALAIPERIAQKAIACAMAMLGDMPKPAATVADQARERLRRLHKAYVAGGLSDDEYDAERARLDLLIAQHAPAPSPQRLDVERAAAVLRDAGSVYTSGAIVERRGVISAMFDRLWLADHRIIAIKPQPAYELLVEAQAGYLVENPTLIGLEPRVSTIPPRWRALREPLHAA